MRRNAMNLGACVLILVVGGGCSHIFKGWGEKPSARDNYADPYAAPSIDYSLPETDAYSTAYDEADSAAPFGSAARYGSTPLGPTTPSRSGATGSAASPSGSGVYSQLAASMPVADSISAARYHVVAKRDTLYSLARRYYSDARKWKNIYEANRTTITNPNKIFVGQRLVIP